MSRAVGVQPKAAEENILKVMHDWKKYGVSGRDRHEENKNHIGSDRPTVNF
jgi:hypothetical protein